MTTCRQAMTFGLLVLSACRPVEPPPLSASPAASASPAQPAPVEPATPPPAAKPAAGPCRDLGETNLAQLPPDRHEKPSTTVALSGACYANARGAWGLRLVGWKREGEEAAGTWAGRLKVSHFNEQGEVTWVPRKGGDEPEGIPLWYGLDDSDLQPPKLVDLDGDGEPEIFVAVHQKIHEGPGYAEAYLLTFKGGAIVPYPGAPATVETLEDLDGDGRMDLTYFPYREDRESPCSGFEYRWSGPAMLAHGLAGGGFSLDDEAAQRFLKRACPAPPRPLKKAPPPSDTPQTAGDAPSEVCARLWGQSEKQAIDLLKQQCKRPKNDQEACQPPPGVCGDHDRREAVARKAPPLTLAAPEAKPREKR